MIVTPEVGELSTALTEWLVAAPMFASSTVRWIALSPGSAKPLPLPPEPESSTAVGPASRKGAGSSGMSVVVVLPAVTPTLVTELLEGYPGGTGPAVSV